MKEGKKCNETVKDMNNDVWYSCDRPKGHTGEHRNDECGI